MKKNKIVSVCLSQVKGQKNIQRQSEIFASRLSSNQVSKGWESSEPGFEEWGIQTIRF